MAMNETDRVSTPMGASTRAHVRQHLLAGSNNRKLPFQASVIALAAAGLWLGWPVLVVAGIAPLLLAVLPCAVMCALGLCMRGIFNRRCSPHESDAPSEIRAATRGAVNSNAAERPLQTKQRGPIHAVDEP
jgi:hypothetical protein